MVTTTETLPLWDLSGLYKSPSDPKVGQDLSQLRDKVLHFSRLRAKVTQLSAGGLLSAMRDLEEIHVMSSKLTAFAYLMKAVDQLDQVKASFFQHISEEMTELHKQCNFFTLEINDIDDIEKHYNTNLASYEPWLQQLRRFKPHQLSLEAENILSDKELTSKDAWVRLFDETHAIMEYNFRGTLVPFAEVAHNLSDKDGKVREDAAHAIAHTLQNNLHVSSFIMNNIVKDRAIDSKLRGFKAPISSRNLANNIDDSVVDVMLQTVISNYESLSHRYYKLKARVFAKDALEYWDRNAPMVSSQPQIQYSWAEATNHVLDAYEAFSPRMASLAQKVLEEHKIDAPISQTKDSGAFCYAFAPGETPYVMMNFKGSARDVSTLAHELGHAIHYMLSEQTMLLYSAPLTFAETASVFGEQLLFRKLLGGETNKEVRAAMISEYIDTMINTIVRQVAFCEFEQAVHAKRAVSELSPEDINAIWIATQGKSLGSGVKLPKEYGCYWSMVPHFIHAPFYVYAYAYGACLVNALYAQYQKEGASFVPKYESLLAMGGAVSLKALKENFGFDLNSAAFWQGGMDIVSDMIDELEGLI